MTMFWEMSKCARAPSGMLCFLDVYPGVRDGFAIFRSALRLGLIGLMGEGLLVTVGGKTRGVFGKE